MMAYRFRTQLYQIALGLCIVASPCWAQISLDGSLGGPSGNLTIGANSEYTIGEELGRQVGGNLFHSFGEFNVATGETATFTGASVIENILSRVTGGDPSNIDGSLSTDFLNATPNLYLLNPAGIVFGANASLDVQGSFHATTADYIALANGTRFNALPSAADASLTTAPPAAFGFLGENPAGITVQGSLATPEGETLSVVSGDLQIDAGTLAAPNGRIDIASADSAGEVEAEEDDLSVESIDRLGEIDVANGGVISTTGEGGGAIFVRSGRLAIDNNSLILANTAGSQDGVGIDLKAQSINLSNGALLITGTSSEGDGGNLSLEAESVSLSGASIATLTGGTGDGGNVSVEATKVSLSGSESSLRASAGAGSGNAGNLTIKANRLDVRDGFQISTETVSDGDAGSLLIEANSVFLSGASSAIETRTSEGNGNAGDLTIKAGSLNVRDGAEINAGTFGKGRGGSLVVDADSVFLSERAFIAATAIEGSGNAGDLKIKVDSLEVTQGAVVSSSTNSGGQGGSLTVEANSVFLSGEGPSGFTGIASQSIGMGKDAGDVVVKASSVEIHDGAEITTSTFGDGQGGNLLVEAAKVSLSGGESAIDASAQAGKGNAGNLTINADSLDVRDGAQIRTGTFSAGDAGNLLVEADRILLSKGGSDVPTGISARAAEGSTGNAGDLTINTGSLAVHDGAQIDTATFSNGDAGRLSVEADSVFLSDSGSTISATAEQGSTGNAGDLTINTGSLAVHDGATIGTTTGGTGQGGNLFVDANSVSLSGDGSGIAAGTGHTGDSGDFTIEASTLDIRDGAAITAGTSGPALAGELTILADNIILIEEGLITALSGATNLDIVNNPDAGRSGSIFITARDSLQLSNNSAITVETSQANAGSITLQVGQLINLNNQSRISTSVADGRGDGGNIAIDPTAVVLNGASGITARARQGRGGNISIITDALFQSPDSVINASSDLGIDGEVNISSPETDLVASTLSLPAAFLDATSLLSERCTPRTAGRSSFIVTGRRMAPPGPEARLPGHVFEFPEIQAPRDGDPEGRIHSTPGEYKIVNLASLTRMIGCRSH